MLLPRARAPDPRASLYRGQHRSENEARKDHDFRFHGIAGIEYIYAHDDPSCNTDCCRVCGNVGFLAGLRFRLVRSAYLLGPQPGFIRSNRSTQRFRS